MECIRGGRRGAVQLRVRCARRSAVFVCGLLVAAAMGRDAAAQAKAPADQRFGGKHEAGFWSGYSPRAGAVVGYVENFTYSVTALRYSYRLRERSRWAVRYAPELTLLSVLHENAPSTTDPRAPVTHFGAGLSPEALQLVLLPRHRLQPFLSQAGGFVYYNGRVLSPGGSQFMYTVDLGAGVNWFTARHTAISLGFRYQHLSNANISHHNPGGDAQTIYVGFSRFHTHSVR